MAAAHRRVHGRPAAVHDSSGELVVGNPTGGRPVDVSAGDLLDLVPLLASGSAWLRLAIDLEAPVPDVAPPRPAPVDRWREPDGAVVAALQAADRPVLLAGPGVVTAGAVPGLHALAAAASLGVLNTWGAKGVFDWRSRHHLATAGLQERDFALAGLGDADLIVATGVDPDEAPPSPLARPGPGGRDAARGAGSRGLALWSPARRDPDAAPACRARPCHPGGLGGDDDPLGPVPGDAPLRPGASAAGASSPPTPGCPATGWGGRSPPPTWGASTSRPRRRGRRASPPRVRWWPVCGHRTGRSSPWSTGRARGPETT